MAKVGEITFDIKKVKQAKMQNKLLRVHIFLCDSFEGEPAESEEMEPRWFDIDVRSRRRSPVPRLTSTSNAGYAVRPNVARGPHLAANAIFGLHGARSL